MAEVRPYSRHRGWCTAVVGAFAVGAGGGGCDNGPILALGFGAAVARRGQNKSGNSLSEVMYGTPLLAWFPFRQIARPA